jgi:hypothetical protein
VDYADTLTGQSWGVNLATNNGAIKTPENDSATITPSDGQSAGLVSG